MLNILYFQNLKPDVIFLNIHMPILNGEEVLSIIKNSGQWKQIPVMVSSAYPKKLARHFLETGTNYLMKRPHLNDYKNEIKQVLNINF